MPDLVNASELTGLPELPENHFWRISHRESQLDKRIRFRIAIIETKLIDIDVPASITNLPHEGEINFSSNGKRYRRWSDNIPFVFRWEYLYDAYSQVEVLAYETLYATTSVLVACAEHIAQKLENERQKQSDEAALIASIVGDYPPKKLAL